MAPDRDAAVLIGISGVSSSGKTTISRLLRNLFPSTFVLHQDDFYKPESELPTKDGFLDWDCAEAISVPDMDAALAHIRAHGTMPPTLSSKEDKNTVGRVPVSDTCIQAQEARVEAWLRQNHPTPVSVSPSSSPPPPTPPICLVDGFLLYTPALDAVTRHLHARLFFLASREQAIARRAARDGYVTLEGFWADPPGYVERVVWPNYADAHAWLFEGGDVERGVLDREALRRAGIQVVEGGEGEDGRNIDMETVLDWAVGRVMTAVDEFVKRQAGEGASVEAR